MDIFCSPQLKYESIDASMVGTIHYTEDSRESNSRSRPPPLQLPSLRSCHLRMPSQEKYDFERQRRKRDAARLRQQRCRARKRAKIQAERQVNISKPQDTCNNFDQVAAVAGMPEKIATADTVTSGHENSVASLETIPQEILNGIDRMTNDMNLSMSFFSMSPSFMEEERRRKRREAARIRQQNYRARKKRENKNQEKYYENFSRQPNHSLHRQSFRCDKQSYQSHSESNTEFHHYPPRAISDNNAGFHASEIFPTAQISNTFHSNTQKDIKDICRLSGEKSCERNIANSQQSTATNEGSSLYFSGPLYFHEMKIRSPNTKVSETEVQIGDLYSPYNYLIAPLHGSDESKIDPRKAQDASLGSPSVSLMSTPIRVESSTIDELCYTNMLSEAYDHNISEPDIAFV